MTVRVKLVRHGAHDLLARTLCGRMDGVALNDDGSAQAHRLGSILISEKPAAIYASPRMRTQQTAQPIALASGCKVQTEQALDEVDFGAWTGATFDDLKAERGWARWNTDRLHTRPPEGESMLEVQTRIAAWLELVATTHDGETIVAVSHGDVIKAACCHALGLSLDFLARFEVDPASLTTLVAGGWGMKLVSLNQN